MTRSDDPSATVVSSCEPCAVCHAVAAAAGVIRIIYAAPKEYVPDLGYPPPLPTDGASSLAGASSWASASVDPNRSCGVGGSSPAGIRRAARFGDAWHPLNPGLQWLRDTALPALHAAAHELGRPVPAFCPRIRARVTAHDQPSTDWRTLSTIAERVLPSRNGS